MNKKRVIEVMDLVAQDAENDVHEMEGKPFTGRAVSVQFGNVGAMLKTLANAVKALVEELVPDDIQAVTFDALVEYGKTHGANIVNGMPWSFEYEGIPITHENDQCYLICAPGVWSLKLHPTQVLMVKEGVPSIWPGEGYEGVMGR